MTALIAAALALSPGQIREAQIDVVAAVIAAEGRGEGWLGMEAIAQVIKNRGLDSFRVVTVPRQFSCLNRTTQIRLVTRMRDAEGWSDARRLAVCLQLPSAARSTYSRDVGNATHYHAKGRKASWAAGKRPVATVGRHVFYKLSTKPNAKL